MFKIILKYSNLQLLIILISFFLVLPFLNETKLSGLILTIFFSLILISSLLVVKEKKRSFKLAATLGSIALLGGWLNSPYMQTTFSLIFSKMMFFIFFVHISIIILRRIYYTKTISQNTIYGAACVYILFGITMATIYTLIEFLSPGSFAFSSSTTLLTANGEPPLFINMFYYSFVTLTTLGYGDIIPIGRIAKMASVLEALCGQLFIALLVARLVGLYTAQQYQDSLKQIEEDLNDKVDTV